MSIMQSKVSSPLGSGTIWTCPLRDIAHMTPQVMAQALNMLAVQHDATHGAKAIDAFAAAIQRFIRLAADPDYEGYVATDTPQAAYVRSGLDKQPADLHAAYAECYAQLMYTCYFNGVREALHPGERALGIAELMASPVRKTLRQRMARFFRR